VARLGSALMAFGSSGRSAGLALSELKPGSITIVASTVSVLHTDRLVETIHAAHEGKPDQAFQCPPCGPSRGNQFRQR
jgi:hypothetical protein